MLLMSKHTHVKKEPKMPFTTSTLQQEAYNRFGMKTKRNYGSRG